MENSKKNNIKERISSVTRVLLLILVFIFLGVSIFYNIKLQEQVNKRDLIIEQLTQRDSILNQIMEIKFDSISKTITYTYRLKDGKVMKYSELSNELDKIHDDYSQIVNKHSKLLKDNIRNIEDYNTLTNDFNSLVNNYGELQKKYNNLIVTYNKNNQTGRSIIDNYNLISDSLSSFKTLVNLIHSKYFIDYKIEKDGNYRKISVKSEKLDSALILLPHFRDRIKKEKNIWKISTRK